MNYKDTVEKNTEQLLRKRNVVMVGYGTKYIHGKNTGRPAIVVGVTKKERLADLAKKDIVPAMIDGIDTDVTEVGEIKLLDIIRTKKFRPAPGGISIGEKSITAGTLGCVVWKDQEKLILSNNHVLANCNQAPIGSEILQPGPADGGNVKLDTLANLVEFVPIQMDDTSDCTLTRATVWLFNKLAKALHRRSRLVSHVSAENLVDCGLAKPTNNKDIMHSILEDSGSHVTVESYCDPTIGLKVKKSGRTTGTTYGQVSLTNVTITVGLGDGKMATFKEQFGIPQPFGGGGDSGSVIMNSATNAAVGLLFAGSDKIIFANTWHNVREALDLD